MKAYASILDILEKGETVAKAIRRLGKNKSKIPSASQRWKVRFAPCISAKTREEVLAPFGN